MTPFDAAVLAALEPDAVALRRLLDTEPALGTATADDGTTLVGLVACAITDDQSMPAMDAWDTYAPVLNVLLSSGADAAAGDAPGWTPMHTAGMSGHSRLVERLLAAGAPAAPEAWDTAGATPMMCALFYAQTDTARALAAADRHPDDLRAAAGLGDLDAVARWLGTEPGTIAEGADAGMAFCRPIEAFPPRERPWTDQTVLDESLSYASRNGQIEAMDRLFAHGADVNANPYRGTPLLWAIYADAVDAATWLLDHGADPDLRHDFGGAEHGNQATAMHLAAQFQSMRCLRLLLDRDADATIEDASWHGSPLDWAVECGQPESEAVLRAHHGGR